MQSVFARSISKVLNLYPHYGLYNVLTNVASELCHVCCYKMTFWSQMLFGKNSIQPGERLVVACF
jgi:hypothetical protein